MKARMALHWRVLIGFAVGSAQESLAHLAGA